jgi:hypothetical protein
MTASMTTANNKRQVNENAPINGVRYGQVCYVGRMYDVYMGRKGSVHTSKLTAEYRKARIVRVTPTGRMTARYDDTGEVVAFTPMGRSVRPVDGIYATLRFDTAGVELEIEADPSKGRRLNFAKRIADQFEAGSYRGAVADAMQEAGCEERDHELMRRHGAVVEFVPTTAALCWNSRYTIHFVDPAFYGWRAIGITAGGKVGCLRWRVTERSRPDVLSHVPIDLGECSDVYEAVYRALAALGLTGE